MKRRFNRSQKTAFSEGRFLLWRREHWQHERLGDTEVLAGLNRCQGRLNGHIHVGLVGVIGPDDNGDYSQ